MTNCKYITKNGRCGLKNSYAYRHGCFGEDMCKCREPMTNVDRIRAMSDEELAKFIDRCKMNDIDYAMVNMSATNAVLTGSSNQRKENDNLVIYPA